MAFNRSWNPSSSSTDSLALTAGQTYDLMLQRVNSQYICSAEGSSASNLITLSNAPFLSGITISDASVRIDWLMVIEDL